MKLDEFRALVAETRNAEKPESGTVLDVVVQSERQRVHDMEQEQLRLMREADPLYYSRQHPRRKRQAARAARKDAKRRARLMRNAEQEIAEKFRKPGKAGV